MEHTDTTKAEFILWLIQQKERDDLVGDLARDVNSEIENEKITPDIGYKKLYSRIKSLTNPEDWDINRMEDTGYEKFKELDEEPPENFVPVVNPLLCLKMAWHEFKTGEIIVDDFMTQ